MKHIKMLDCTLRDGGYLIDSNFGENVIRGFIKNMVDANIDIIECGFLKDEKHVRGTTVFNNASQIREYLPQRTKNASFVVLADYSRYSIENLEPYDKTSIDGVRACFFKKERREVINFCKQIKEKGYKLYVQPVDILGYTDIELLELINEINKLAPHAFSIVDTFGSMYKEELLHVYSLVNNNLSADISIGFHSHNNLQMSFALSQDFIKNSFGERNVIVDSTVCGMGRGAGNTNTELITQYVNKKYKSNYDIDIILDAIDNYIGKIHDKCSWGYSIPYFLAGIYSAHVNNIKYLGDKPSICARDMRKILHLIEDNKRKRYDFDLLEKLYVDYTSSNIEDFKSVDLLKILINKRKVVILAPGSSLLENKNKIKEYISQESPIVISVNFISEDFKSDLVFFANKKRYNYWMNDKRIKDYSKILTSNIKTNGRDNEYIVNYTSLIKCENSYIDNSLILLLRLLDRINVENIKLAGFDGFDVKRENNYFSNEMELYYTDIKISNINMSIEKMLEEFKSNREGNGNISFLTSSRFENIF